MFQKIEDSTSNDSSFCDLVQKNLNMFLTISRKVQDAALFSTNEELDDISTSSLKFLLIDYNIAELLGKLVDSNQTIRDITRITNLKLSLDRYWSFLSKCETLNLIHKQDLEALHREEVPNATIKREEKIARFKREKEAQNLLKEVLIKRNKKGFKNETEEEEEEDETLRSFTLLLLDIAIRKSIENYFAVKEEIEMLENVINIKQKSGGKLPTPKEKPPQFKNFILLPNKRDQLKRDVFKPNYPLPTMTVEEWAEEEMRLGLMPSPNDPKPQKSNDKDSDNEEEDDQKTLKARNWDDWKDDHPRGEGNKNDRYFSRG